MSKLKVSIRSIVMFLFALMFVVAGLSLLSRYTSEQFIYRSKKPLKIGATYMTLNNPFFNVIDDEVRNVVEANGDVLISLDPALDLQKQKEQIHYLIEQGVSALIINPVDFTGLSEELKEAREANIPVITVDTDVFDEDLVAYSLMSDNYDAGVQCAKDMMKRKKSANIVLLQHSTAYSAVQRIQGFVDTIKDKPQYRVVERIECEGQLEIAMPKMDAFLNKDISFDVVMALNDPSALGALAAMQDKDRLQSVLVYGVDGSPETKALIKDHIMTASVSQSPKTMGKDAAEIVYKILENKPYSSKARIPVTLINENNIDQFSLEGWH